MNYGIMQVSQIAELFFVNKRRLLCEASVSVTGTDKRMAVDFC